MNRLYLLTKYFITEIQSQERAGCENTAGEQRAMVDIFTSEKRRTT